MILLVKLDLIVVKMFYTGVEMTPMLCIYKLCIYYQSNYKLYLSKHLNAMKTIVIENWIKYQKWVDIIIIHIIEFQITNIYVNIFWIGYRMKIYLLPTLFFFVNICYWWWRDLCRDLSTTVITHTRATPPAVQVMVALSRRLVVV